MGSCHFLRVGFRHRLNQALNNSLFRSTFWHRSALTQPFLVRNVGNFVCIKLDKLHSCASIGRAPQNISLPACRRNIDCRYRLCSKAISRKTLNMADQYQKQQVNFLFKQLVDIHMPNGNCISNDAWEWIQSCNAGIKISKDTQIFLQRSCICQ
jgi:hypothetical protein